jgi:hypothetical protein
MKAKLSFLSILSLVFLLNGCWIGGGECDDGPMCDVCGPTGCYDEECNPAFCEDTNDCLVDEFCDTNLNQCYPIYQCFEDWDCPAPLVCDDTNNVCVNPNGDTTCRSDFDCPATAFCDESTGRCVDGGSCETSSQCGDGYYCDDRNVCSPEPAGDCINDTQCGHGAYCDEISGECIDSGICDNVSCDLNMVCDDRGTCVPDETQPATCLVQSDCNDGQDCVNGICNDTTPRDPSKNCLVEEHCGENGVCVDGRCYSACVDEGNCGTGEVCGTTFCEPDSYPAAECILDIDCGTGTCVNTRCHDVCTIDGDCSNSNDYCLEGVCVPNDVATPQCFIKADCAGGEECFDGICRVPCVDDDDCIACPGNPTCATGGYCMDENDINPECALTQDCDPNMSCVNAMCN